MAGYTAAVKGGYWPENGVVSLTNISTTSAARRRAAMALKQRGQRALRELMETLNGATAGSAASKTIARVEHPSDNDMSGVRAIEIETLVGRNTIAADVTLINADILQHGGIVASPPVNGDGNPLGVAA